jgi:diguanylate cyclase (GGDEF)-like protein/PAS domain S-box-containing protein
VVDTIRLSDFPAANTAASSELPASLGQYVLEACAAPMIVFERRGNDCLVRYVNPAFARRTGYSMVEVAQIGWDGLHMDEGREQGMARLRAAIGQRRELEMPLRIYGKDGVTFSAALEVSPVGDGAESTGSYAVGVLREMPADAEYVSRLEREAHYDPLTGLPNRRLLAERGKRVIAQALREAHLLGVALIDFDGFKLVNDTLGHAAGDQVLRTVGARLARDMRPGDFIARVGGDEFVLLVLEQKGHFSLASVIERVRGHIEDPIQLHGQSLTMACSIGVAVCPGNGDDLAALLRHADRAMYREKARNHSIRATDRLALHQSTAPS